MRRAVAALTASILGAVGVLGPWKVATGSATVHDNGLASSMSPAGWLCALLLAGVALLAVTALQGGTVERERLDRGLLYAGPLGLAVCAWSAFTVSSQGPGGSDLTALGVNIRPGWGVLLCVGIFATMTTLAFSAYFARRRRTVSA